jgi:hypothetical protein
MGTRAYFGWVLAVQCLTSTGCGGGAVSLRPIYTEADLIADDSLVGAYHDNESTVIVRKNDHGLEAVGPRDENGRKDPPVELHVLRIGSHYFLDILFPDKASPTDQRTLHMVARLARMGDRLRLRFLDMKWAADCLERDPNLVKHRLEKTKQANGRIARDILLDDEPKNVQWFLLKALADPASFAGTGEARPATYLLGLRFNDSLETDEKAAEHFLNYLDLQAPGDTIAEHGLASQMQRTFDFWWEIRFYLARLAFAGTPTDQDHREDDYRLVARSLRSLPTRGVDPAATQTAVALADLIDAAASTGGETLEPDKLADLITTKLVEPIRHARAKLTARYQMDYAPLLRR